MDVVLPKKAERVCGGIAEPNTFPELLTTYDGVMRYLEDLHTVAPGRAWSASIYVTPEPNIPDIQRLHRAGVIGHLKDYPPGGSTHTQHSASFEALINKNSLAGRLMCVAEDERIPVKRHPEIVTHNGQIVDQYAREPTYLREYEPRFMDTYPQMRRILAHISTREAAHHMKQYGNPYRYVAELPPVHGCCDRRILADGGSIITYHHCLPPVQDVYNMAALQNMQRQKPTWLMAASDAAGHGASGKFAFLAGGGLYTYHCDLEMYIETLAGLGILDYAYDFLYGNAKRFFGDLVPDNPTPVKLVRQEWSVNETVPIPGTDDYMIPFGYHPDEAKRYRYMYKVAA